ncbi:hypothetical protein [Priestia megaterium]|uniref:hypothetical protein n=1 Tax=Priestia megaterium TaxID=1404 RepID=UPI001126AB22|nr:hypothetical protein [Priestia megaterium]TPF17991.1 hypothetical protein CBE78_01835 [Priestia megaterium]TPF22099.1 hypothetical protein CBE79_04340 [Priestia megaterium]
MRYNAITLFSAYKLYDYLEKRKSKLKENIDGISSDYILNANEEDYKAHIKEIYMIDLIKLNIDQSYIKKEDEYIAAEEFPFNYYVVKGKSYRKTVYYIFIPFEGDDEVLLHRPSTFTLSPSRAHIENGKLVLRCVQFEKGIEEINKTYEEFIKKMNIELERVNSDLSSYNKEVVEMVDKNFNHRKKEALEQRNEESLLSIPIKRKSEKANTFNIPTPKLKEKIEIKTKKATKNSPPIPTVDYETYIRILSTINDMGKQFERTPFMYKNNGEESLRDYFLLHLEPSSNGSATGETFNKTGKTDILLRYEGANIFVGECKFWRGEKSLIKTIDQLLGYLTWRDSKTAVIMFVDNKDFKSVLNKAEKTIVKHTNYIKTEEKHDDSWINYTFKLNNESNEEIKLAMMLYHIPKE